MIFDKEEREKHIVPEIKIKDDIEYLLPVEGYFHYLSNHVFKEETFTNSYDCTANESTYFNTLNYTLYAGMFIMHPLCFSTQTFQMYDAMAHDVETKDYVGWLMKQDRNKYLLQDGKPLNKTNVTDIEGVVILPGANKFQEFVCGHKLNKLADIYGKKLVIKPHPNDSREVINTLKRVGISDKVTMASPLDDMYDLIDKSPRVFTTHISESCLIAKAMGKEVQPIDPFNNRLCGSFSHINNILFTDETPIQTINKVFSSYKSGVINPLVDDDWKAKMFQYFEYIIIKRNLQKDFYEH